MDLPLIDRTLAELTDYCATAAERRVPDEVVHAASQRIVDALACAVGAFDAPAAAIARRTLPAAAAAGVLPPGRPLGAGRPVTTTEAAAFVNTILIRYLDYNDHWPGGHPSDVVGPLVTLADALDRSGAELVRAVVVAYDVFVRLAEPTVYTFRHDGWDQGFGLGMATAAGASVLLGLDAERTRHALSLTAVTSMALRATRAGELSLWKGAATAYAAKNALFTTMLAADGMTGPQAPIEGRHGLQDTVTGPFSIQPFTAAAGGYDIGRTRLKYWPVEYNLQAVVWAGLELHPQISPEQVRSIDVATYWNAWHECASEPAKWDPRTRETADHSLPYVLAYTLRTGSFDVTAFEPDAYLDPSLRDLMSRISARIDDELQAGHPDTIGLRVVVEGADGRRLTAQVTNPRGHTANPMTDDEIADKFLRCAAGVLDPAAAEKAVTLWWNVAAADFSVRAGVDLLSVDRPASTPR